MHKAHTPPFDDRTGQLADDLDRRIGQAITGAAHTDAVRANPRLRDALNRAAGQVLFGPPEERFWALVDLGDALADCEEIDAATRAYQDALVCEPGAPEPLFGLALLCGCDGRRDDAVLYGLAALRGVCATPGPDSLRIGADIVGFLLTCDARDQVAQTLQDAGWPASITTAWLTHTV